MTGRERTLEVAATEELGLVPDSSTVFDGARIKKFDRLIGERQALKESIKQSEVEVKLMDEQITAMLTDRDVVKVKHSGYTVSLCQGSSSSLSKDMLLQHGVAAVTIAECTKISSYNYVLVTKPKTR